MLNEMKSSSAGDENTSLPSQNQTESTNADQSKVPSTAVKQKGKFGKWLLVILIFLLILIFTNVSTGYFLRSNNTSNSSSCSVSWVDFPKQISPNTSYTVYIKKINTTHKWRDVSVFKDIDIYPNAPRENGLTGDDWQNPTNTYTFTFNSGDMGEHKLYFYNNDFESYGESSGTGPKTLCEPVFRYITEEKTAPTTNNTVKELTPKSSLMPALISTDSAGLQTYTFKKINSLSFPGFTIQYPKDWTVNENRIENTLSELTLMKNEMEIKIYQAAMGGAGCIYKGEVPEGPYSDLRNKPYVDVISKAGIFRRTQYNDKNGYSFCQSLNNGKTFGGPTTIGGITYITPSNADESILEEMDNIIKSIIIEN